MFRFTEQLRQGIVQSLRDTEARRSMRRGGIRRYWLTVHKYLALSVGLVFVLLGLTGSHNAFMYELDELWNPDLVIAHPGAAYRPMEEILAAVKAAHPELPGPWLLQMPRHRAGMLTASHSLPKGEAGGMYYNALLVSVNPYTAQVVRSRHRRDTAMGWIFDLHCALLLSGTGQKAVGIVGLALLASVLSGLCLWWPRGNGFGQAFAIKRGASVERFNFDLHKCLGIYSVVILSTLAFSGVYLIYSDYVRPLVNVFSPVAMDPWSDLEGLASTVRPGSKAISADRAIQSARMVYPEAELQQLSIPRDATGVYTLRLRQPGEANRSWPSTAVYVDQYSGEVIAIRDPNRFSRGETFLNLQYPLHSGEALGLPGRILVCLTGFMPLALYITGIVRWVQKRKARRRAYARRHTSS